jgi:hypothetical protein
MLPGFFNGKGNFAMDMMEEGRIIGSVDFHDTVLPQVWEAAHKATRVMWHRRLWSILGMHRYTTQKKFKKK